LGSGMARHQMSRAGPARPSDGRGWRRARAVARSMLAGAAVFAIAALTGALLAGATIGFPADPPPSPQEQKQEPASDNARTGDSVDDTFAQSLVLTGVTALAVSSAGMVMVGRR